MRWIAKALVQRALSAIPHGEALNYQLQRHVTRSLPASEPVFRMHIHEACRHYDAMRRHRPALAPQQAVAYEFGAGWDLVGPLTLAVLGIRHQLLVDIRENLRLQLVNDTLVRLRRRRPDLERSRPEPLPELPLEPVTSYDDLESRLGVRYVAPCDARRTPLPAGSVDVISSTFTLEHIPETDIAAILRESARLLCQDGIVSCAIDMKDHYSYFDPRLGPTTSSRSETTPGAFSTHPCTTRTAYVSPTTNGSSRTPDSGSSAKRLSTRAPTSSATSSRSTSLRAFAATPSMNSGPEVRLVATRASEEGTGERRPMRGQD